MDAVALLQEWIVEVGSAAGLTPQNTFLATGSVGAPESTLEVRGGGEAHCRNGQQQLATALP